MVLRPDLLGNAQVASPIVDVRSFVSDGDHIQLSVSASDSDDTAFERAGPRVRIYFEPARVRAAIVTCGGLCPGLNHVVRALVLSLEHSYGVTDVLGYRYGYEGLTAQGEPPKVLTSRTVSEIHRVGGSYLGVSRGKQDIATMLDTSVRDGVSMLFAVGGDGTLRGAHEIAKAAKARNLPIAVVGIPKTIDNDVAYVDRTFGFDTAVSESADVLLAAHAEARSARRGVCIVQLMGRDAGFITAHATLASGEVNLCLVPEVHVAKDAVIKFLDRRLAERGHALIAVAEGCAAMLNGESGDARGKDRDVGQMLKQEVVLHFEALGAPAQVKFIDPSYSIRSVVANASDAIYCDQLARHAVHAAMSGRTDVLVGRLHGQFVYVPLAASTGVLRRVEPEGELWRSVMQATGQPRLDSSTL